MTRDADHIGDHWSRQARDTASREKTLRWWRCEHLKLRINERICGRPVPGTIGGLMELVKDRFGDRLPLGHGVSVGGSNGRKEMLLLEAGIVERVTVFELAEAFVEEGRREAAERGLADRLEFVLGDAFAEPATPRFDLVHWNNALHHMPDTPAAVRWSRDVLRPGGLFLMDDYVGPDRHQWTDTMLAVAAGVRRTLPQRYLRDPHNEGALLPVDLARPMAAMMERIDPSEAADSERILPAVAEVFPGAHVQATGGVVYHLALNDVLANFDESGDNDRLLLDMLMLVDDMAVALGETHYAVALAEKSGSS